MELQPFRDRIDRDRIAEDRAADDSVSIGPSLQDYFQILRRRRTIILQAFVLISVVGVIVTLTTKPTYQASAKLLVDQQSMNMNTVDSSNPLSSLLALNSPQSVDTQIEVLESGPLMGQVTQQVGPINLDIEPEKDANIIVVTAEGNDPKAVGDAPNVLLSLYLTNDADQSLTEIKSAKQFVQQQGALASQKLDAVENAMKKFRQENHVQDLDKDRAALSEHVALLESSYQKAATDVQAVRAQMASDQSLLANLPVETVVTQKSTNPKRAALQSKIDDLQFQRVGLIQRGGYAVGANKIVALDAQMAELKRQLAAQPSLLSSQAYGPNLDRDSLHSKLLDLQTQAAALGVQQAGLKIQLAQAEATSNRLAGFETQFEQLQRERDAALPLEKMFADKLADLTLREEAHHATARIIQHSEQPSEPVRPKKLQSILFACVIGLFIGLILALLQEFLDDRISSQDDANRLLGLPALGTIPALTPSDARLLPQMENFASASEGYRVLRTNINFTCIDAPLRTLLVTSASPGEGKTTTAANLAFAMAMDGKKVILVDTDLRRPSLHTLFDLPSIPGLTDVLLGQVVPQAFELMPGLLVLTAGTLAPNPSELLNSRKFRDLVDILTNQADLVIFDSSPLLAASDAAILASQMDGTVLVLETGNTKKASAVAALKQLRHARANVLGVAHNKALTRSHSGYYYAYEAATGSSGNLPTAVPSVTLGRDAASRILTVEMPEEIKGRE